MKNNIIKRRRIMAMALKKEELITIGEYVQEHLTEWLPEYSFKPADRIYPIELGERMVRVEEELKNQRELMKQGFDQMDKRIELIQINMDKHFEQIEKRFEQVDKRFEQIEKRFEQVDKRFEQIEKRFEQVDKRFESIQQNTNRNFDEVNTRLKAIETKMFQFMIWSTGFSVTVAGIVVGLIKFT
ncbi:MAG: hypothetical protein L3J12_07745 [Spirochaetales bacterium]|nr:hypothetical protein [Spirochaetales bacterium]